MTTTEMSLVSQISSLEMSMRRYERKARKATSVTAEKRYLGMYAIFASRCSELREKLITKNPDYGKMH